MDRRETTNAGSASPLSSRIGAHLEKLTLCDNAAADAHGLHFLEQELVGIRNLNGAEVRRVRASTADPDTLCRISHGN